MIDTLTIYPDDTPLDHLAKTRIILSEMCHADCDKRGMTCLEVGDDPDHARIHDAIRHLSAAAEKMGAKLHEHPTFVAWETGYDRVHNPDAPYLHDEPR